VGPSQVHRDDLKASLRRSVGELCCAGKAYLVTGSLRSEGLGFLNARWLVSQGAEQIVLCGRSAPPLDLPVHELQGAEVHLCQADVCLRSNDGETGRKSLRSVLDTQMPGVRMAGVFHAAAHFQDGLFRTMDRGHLDKVLRPKVEGTLVLADTFSKDPLELFVLHSSIVAVTGNWGQVAYGAANNFMDAFAVWRRARGLPAQSINWPSLEGVGVLKGDAGSKMVEQLRETRGFESLDRTNIMRAMTAVLCLNRPQLAVSSFDFEKVQRTVLWKNPFARGRFHTMCAPYGHASRADPLQVVRDGRSSKKVILSILEEVLFSVDNNGPEEGLQDEHRTLSELGLQSGDAITARHRLNTELGISVSINDLLDVEESTANVIKHLIALSDEASSGSLRDLPGHN